MDADRFIAVSEFVIFELHPRRAKRLARAPAEPLAGLTVLSYHRIADDKWPEMAFHRARGMVVTPSVFAAQMRALGCLFQPVRLEDVVRAARGRGTLPPRAVWVTFDDGYSDVMDSVIRC